jgi:hypothetical protein
MLAGATIVSDIGRHDTGTQRYTERDGGWQWVLNGIG